MMRITRVLALLLITATLAGAQPRYRAVLDFGDGQTFVIYSGDASLPSRWTGSADERPGLVPGAFPNFAPPAAAGAPAIDTTARLGLGVLTPVGAGTDADASLLAVTPPAPPAPPAAPPVAPPPNAPPNPTTTVPMDPNFQALLQNVYLVTNQADIDAAWARYQDEDANLPMGPRAGNAVIKQAIAQDPNPVGDADVARMRSLQAGNATVATPTGVGMRDDKWTTTMENVSQGEQVTILGPPDADGWVQVQYNGKTGYINGLWLRP